MDISSHIRKSMTNITDENSSSSSDTSPHPRFIAMRPNDVVTQFPHEFTSRKFSSIQLLIPAYLKKTSISKKLKKTIKVFYPKNNLNILRKWSVNVCDSDYEDHICILIDF